MQVAHPEANALLTARELSAQIGWSESTIYRKRSLGQSLPKALKIGSSVRWTQASVDAWIAQQVEAA